jgi:hypothetical protein
MDKIVEDVISKFKQRSETGVKKYHTTLEENINDDFLTHAQEEAMDFVLYLEKIKSIIKSLGYDRIEEVIN